MNTFDSTRPTDSAIDSLMSTFSTPSRDEIDVANTLRQRSASNATTSQGALRDALEGDDRQVPAPSAMLDRKFDHDIGPSSNERVRPGARRSSWASLRTLVSVVQVDSLDRALRESIVVVKKLAIP